MTSTAYVPSGFTVVVRVCCTPLLSVTTIVMRLPGAASVVPVMVGVVSRVSSGALTVIVGAVVSSSAESLPSGEVLPAGSVMVATTVIVSPSAGAGSVKFT